MSDNSVTFSSMLHHLQVHLVYHDIRWPASTMLSSSQHCTSNQVIPYVNTLHFYQKQSLIGLKSGQGYKLWVNDLQNKLLALTL